VLFELIAARYERRSLLITANQPFGEWGKVFPDPAMTVAVVDRLVHHATILEMNVESFSPGPGAHRGAYLHRLPRLLPLRQVRPTPSRAGARPQPRSAIEKFTACR
jgi:hypothetical protein